MKVRPWHLIPALILIIAALFGAFKFGEHQTAKESNRQGYTRGFLEGFSDGAVKASEKIGGKRVRCDLSYPSKGVYADVNCRLVNGPWAAGWFWQTPKWVGPGPAGPATSGPNAE
ncbi:hypothetical protein [Shimazuella soli]|uniref:hypothetical protein n=1 Tax=Shimazuella soli TaxID=1892854 RepID=UPI001F101E1A|nr:hypothetical protein [Shimazuella soli]